MISSECDEILYALAQHSCPPATASRLNKPRIEQRKIASANGQDTSPAGRGERTLGHCQKADLVGVWATLSSPTEIALLARDAVASSTELARPARRVRSALVQICRPLRPKPTDRGQRLPNASPSRPQGYGNHLFFVGEEGARATIEAMERLRRSASEIRRDLSEPLTD